MPAAEETGLGAVGHGVGAVAAGPVQRELGRASIRRPAGHEGAPQGDAGVGMLARICCAARRVGLGAAWTSPDRAGKVREPSGTCIARQDVVGGAAVDHPMLIVAWCGTVSMSVRAPASWTCSSFS